MVAGPAVVLAGLGLTHPQELTAASASWWTTLHVILLPIFPLLAVSLWLLLRGVPGPVVAWVARIVAYGYAVFYSVTDVLVGVGAGELTRFNAARGVQERTVEVDWLIIVATTSAGSASGASWWRAPRPRWRWSCGLAGAPLVSA
jgi:hypothetical protein